MAAHDYYRTLGVTPEVSSEDIKKAYRHLALKYHPDRNPDDHDGEEQLKAINEAYQVLGDEGKRQRYDFFHSRGLKDNAAYNEGVDDLGEAIKKRVIRENIAESQHSFIANSRQIASLERALYDLECAVRVADNGEGMEIISLYLKEALTDIDEMRGTGLSEQVLDEIFKHFCVGK